MYSKKLRLILQKKKIKIGDRVRLEFDDQVLEGLLMPKPNQGDPDALVIKLDNGYNIGIKWKDGINLSKSSSEEPEIIESEAEFELGKLHPKFRKKLEYDPNKPTISILHTGGTIASVVDYNTGGVISRFTPQDLLHMFPEIFDIANIETRLVRNMWSEDMVFEHYRILAKEIEKEIRKGVRGIIIGHGTDTMHYTAAALSFIFEDLPVPVILVGAQRSSDRGSSDAGMNLICATRFIIDSDFSGVAICMHESPSDDFCFILPATKSRKCHTSRRDAFRPINDLPIARVDYKTGKIIMLRDDYKKFDPKRKPKIFNKFEKKVGLLKIHPDMDPKIMEFYIHNGYKGLVLEGTGLGHTPGYKIDEFTNGNRLFFEGLKKFIAKGGIIVMTSQCLWGRVNMNVYDKGIDLQNIGIIPGEDMLPETAYIKLAWLLGNFSIEEAKKMIRENLRGEITTRTLPETFLY
ncbi:MAG: Glu-tRNA(Gln) amidotransferase GatDE subunit D [Candidatus Aenigmatarchaeota archaeon]|nr:MAG: Glu-tRNA(Gln) amidotransferase GatDE subunit D [Candidatus Aenigmarchaeota archaeon]